MLGPPQDQPNRPWTRNACTPMRSAREEALAPPGGTLHHGNPPVDSMPWRAAGQSRAQEVSQPSQHTAPMKQWRACQSRQRVLATEPCCPAAWGLTRHAMVRSPAPVLGGDVTLIPGFPRRPHTSGLFVRRGRG